MCEFVKKIPFAAVKAVITRSVFVVHSLVIVYRVVEAYDNPIFWLLLISLLGLFIETLVTLIKRGGKEWTWFSPAIFCYLLSAVPPIWLLEIQLTDLRIKEANRMTQNTTNSSSSGDAFGIEIGLQLSLDHAGWTLAMEQALLFILILGRWFMPKGNISRNQLSQILLVYLGMAADIMELFEVFKEEQVAYSNHLTYPTLTLWSWALLQYTLVITTTKARKPRYGAAESDDDVGDVYETGGCCRTACGCDSVNVDVLGIMSTILMQDGPFLCYRMYLLVGLGVVSQMMVFFTCKNLLVLLLQIYRLIVIYFEIEKEEDEEGNPGSDMRGSKSSGGNWSSNNSPIPTLKLNGNTRDEAAYNGRGNSSLSIENEGNGTMKARNRVTPTPEQTIKPERPDTRQSWEGSQQDALENEADHPHSVNSFSEIP